MYLTSWENKFQIIENFQGGEEQFAGNSMGIYIEYVNMQELHIHYKPLNENFNGNIFLNKLGILLNFERDLIDEDDIEYALDVMSLFNRSPRFILSDSKEIEHLKSTLHHLKSEFHREDSSYIMLKTLLKVLLLRLIRCQNDHFIEQDLNQKRVFQFLELMETHFLNEPNSLFYAEKLGISEKRLNQILKAKLKLTAKQIIQQRQITEAKRELVKSEITTKELAYMLGFNSISSFSRFFRKNTGISPSEFKKTNTVEA